MVATLTPFSTTPWTIVEEPLYGIVDLLNKNSNVLAETRAALKNAKGREQE
jgi:hypothetical protein